MAAALVAELERRGFTVAADRGQLIVRPASQLTSADREEIREHKAAILSTLSGWDQTAAHALMRGVDDAVESTGADGRHPDIQAAARRILDTCRQRDMPALRGAVAKTHELIRGLASPRSG